MSLLVLAPGVAAAQVVRLNLVELLGINLVFDKNLSAPEGQSCATCHIPAAGWKGESSDINATEAIYRGARHVRSGNRKPPGAAFASPSPVFYFDAKEGHFVGGNFWDGRASGWLLRNRAAEQAQGRFVNPVEQDLPDERTVVQRVCSFDYGSLFRQINGDDICGNTIRAYNPIGQALAAYENSKEVNAFTSKYDYYLKDSNKYPLSKQELWGLRLFEVEKKRVIPPPVTRVSQMLMANQRCSPTLLTTTVVSRRTVKPVVQPANEPQSEPCKVVRPRAGRFSKNGAKIYQTRGKQLRQT